MSDWSCINCSRPTVAISKSGVNQTPVWSCHVCGARGKVLEKDTGAEFVLSEIRLTDPDSGAAKGSKLARFDLIPTRALWILAEHYGRNLEKYPPRNWEAGYDWSLSYAALHRHLNQWWSGEDLDPETGSPHLAAVAWHALTLLEYSETHPEKDDRPK